MESEKNVNTENESTSNSNITNVAKACCPCTVCTCGENCTCASGIISCDPCGEFVENCKRQNKD